MKITYTNPFNRGLSGWQNDVVTGKWMTDMQDGQRVLIVETDEDLSVIDDRMEEQYPVAKRIETGE